MVMDGIYYALALGGAGVLLAWLGGPLLALPLFLLALFCLYFFRDPEREAPEGPVAVSPADGKVVAVKAIEDATRISIFLNIFDVHVNRSPIAGRISDVHYQPGKFLVASKEDASTQNEQNTLVVEDGESRIVFRQIAGLIARRIVCWKRTGDEVGLGERIGLIKFGSRVDVFLGPEWTVDVKVGERVEAGSSVLAHRRAA
jgi:phosphatidylserine decarboxylase